MKPSPLVKVRVRHINAQAAQKVLALVRDRIADLARLRKIDAAHVSFEQQREAAPAFCVQVHLETPGPDIRVEGRDYTLLAAAVRALGQLHRHIRLRQAKQQMTPRDRCEHPRALPSRTFAAVPLTKHR